MDFLSHCLKWEQNVDNKLTLFKDTLWPMEDQNGAPVMPSEQTVVELPYYYHQISHLILSSFSQDIPSSSEISSLISSLHYLRCSKIQSNLALESYRLQTLSEESSTLPQIEPLYNLGSGWKGRECALFKGSVISSFNKIYSIGGGTAAEEETTRRGGRFSGRRQVQQQRQQQQHQDDDDDDDDDEGQDDDMEEPRAMPTPFGEEGGSRLRRFR